MPVRQVQRLCSYIFWDSACAGNHPIADYNSHRTGDIGGYSDDLTHFRRSTPDGELERGPSQRFTSVLRSTIWPISSMSPVSVLGVARR